MSGDHNQYQKDKSYLDFECPRCGHCCQQEHTNKKVMQQALDMLNGIADHVYFDQTLAEVITALEQALAVSTGEWVGLTDDEIAQGLKESWVTEQAWQSAVWWAEAKLKEKNNG